MLHRPARTFVSMIGIGIGILLVVFTIGLANGSLRERAQRESNVGAELMIRPSGSVSLSASDALNMSLSMVTELEKIDGVAAVVPVATVSVPANDGGLTGSRLIDGVPFDKYAAIAGLQVVQGRVFVPGRDEMMADTAWLDRRKARIGDKFSIYDRDFDIVGVYEPSAGARIKIPLTTLQEQLGSPGNASAFLVKVRDGLSPRDVGDRIQARFPDNQLILTSELEELYMQGLPALNVFLDVIVVVAAVISALIILLTMYTTVTERTRQIGVLKSLGKSNVRIAFTIVQEALLIAMGGVIFGVAATFGLKYAMARSSTLTVSVDPTVVLTVAGIGLASSVIGALYPGLRAARLDAVEALNYE